MEINRHQRTLMATNGLEVTYDRLLLATDSKLIMIPVLGIKLPGVVTFRNINDVDRMLKATNAYKMPWLLAVACWAWRRPIASLSRECRLQ